MKELTLWKFILNNLRKKQPVIFSGHITSSDGGSTYFGNVVATGAINKTGTFVMPTQVLGMALHCTFILTFPDGTITIRLNCNMVTFNGQWQVLDGTGAYQNLKGNGSLIMPNNDDENFENGNKRNRTDPGPEHSESDFSEAIMAAASSTEWLQINLPLSTVGQYIGTCVRTFLSSSV